VYADGKRVVAWDGATRWQPESGQFLFNFETAAVLKRAAAVAKLPSPKRTKLPTLTADQWCDLAMEIEENSPLDARAAYHHAIDLDPGRVVARITLGRLLHTEGNLVGAEAHFREAVRYDPECALGWYNLGVVLEDLERAGEALPCYEQAVRADATL